MEKLSKISRRAAAFGLASSGVCQAAQPLIDLTEKRSPILSFNAKDALSSTLMKICSILKNHILTPNLPWNLTSKRAIQQY